MASVFRRKDRKKYVIQYTDAHGRQRKKTGTVDKVVTQRMARAIENDVALVKAGLVDPKTDAYRRHEAQPLELHLADYRRTLLAKGDSDCT